MICSYVRPCLESRVPNVPSVSSSQGYVLRRTEDRVWCELLAEHSQLRAVFIHPNVRTTHPPLAIERSASMEDSVVINNCKE